MFLAALVPPTIPQFDPIELVARYRAYRLPEPPLDAKPVVCTDESSVQLPGFAVADKPNVVYRPWSACAIGAEDEERVLRPLATVPLKDTRADEELWPTIAILESRGEERDADRLLRAVFANREFDDPQYASPWRPLRERAWAYWRAQAIDNPAERAKLSLWLRSWSKIDGLQPSEAERSFLKDLEATLAPAPAHPNPNRFDRLMEQTLTAQGEALSDQKYGPNMVDGVSPLAKPIVRLWEAGFDAVPTMFRYLGDRRITRLGGPHGRALLWTGGDLTRYHRICDVAADVILTALQEGPDPYATRPREWDYPEEEEDPYALDRQVSRVKAMWPKWLADKKIGEKNVLLKQMTEMDEEEKGTLDTVSTDGARAYPLRVLAIKYPSALSRFLKHVKYAHERDQIQETLYETKGRTYQAG